MGAEKRRRRRLTGRLERELRAQVEEDRLMAEGVGQLIWTGTPEGKGEYCNRHWCAYTGLTMEESAERWSSVIHPDDLETAWALMGRAQETLEPYDLEYRLRRADGQYRWFLFKVAPVRDAQGRLLRWIGAGVDVDDRKRLVEAERAAHLAAERANRAKDEFLAVLSHELRAPVTTILMYAQLLLRGGLDEATSGKAVRTIERAALSQAQLINDLLDVSRIVAGQLQLEQDPVELTAVVGDAVQSVRASAAARQVALETVSDVPLALVEGDGARLRQVVCNLLVNSIKFTPPGGRIEVRVDRAGDQARILVSDTGMGIAPEFLGHVFDRFAQLDASTTRAHGGLGLGLAIVRHLVELHHGSVTAESAGLGQGARFVVSLPLASTEPQPTAAPPNATVVPKLDIAGLRVLVVEDDDGTREALEQMLTTLGAEVRGVESAARAVPTLEQFRPDVMLCDIAMPGEDGLSVIRRVRALAPEHGGATPAAALTALASEEDRQRALAAGFQRHLSKPVSLDELATTVHWLAGRSAG